MAVTHLDGRAFERFIAAGTYFLRKYRGVLNDLNVFPVPDGDTGSNMFLTAKAALREAHAVRDQPLSVVAGAAAHGSLLGARGNSGVILSQMLRGFAHSVRHRDAIDTFQLSLGLREAAAAARAALTKPVEGTILSVATAAADEAYRLAVREPDFYRLANAVVRAANDALDRTPEQLPALKEAGVVDSGGAGLCYFLEGVLRFLPQATVRTTAFPHRPGSFERVHPPAGGRRQPLLHRVRAGERHGRGAPAARRARAARRLAAGDRRRAHDQGARPLRRARHGEGHRRQARDRDALEARGHGRAAQPARGGRARQSDRDRGRRPGRRLRPHRARAGRRGDDPRPAQARTRRCATCSSA